MVKRPQQRERRWSVSTWLAIGTGVVALLALTFTFLPGIKAVGQYTLGDSSKLNASDTQALKRLPLGKELTARGLTPLYKSTKNDDVQWSVPCDEPDPDNCIRDIVNSGNRVVYTRYTRDWRGEIDSMQLTLASWFLEQTGQPGVAVLTSVSLCSVLPGTQLNDLFTHDLPHPRYCM